MNSYVLYWKEEEDERKWKPIPDTIKSRQKAIQAEAMFFTWMTFADPINGSEDRDHQPNRKGFFPTDFDHKPDPQKALADLRSLYFDHLPREYGIDPYAIRYFATGSKGFHAEISPELFGCEAGDPLLPLIFKKIACEWAERFRLSTADLSLFCLGLGKMWRIPNVRRSNGRYKVPLAMEEVRDLPFDELWKLTESPRNIEHVDVDLKPLGELVELYQRTRQSVYEELEDQRKHAPIPKEKITLLAGELPPCISHILKAYPRKSKTVNFNKLTMILVNYFHAAGVESTEAWEQAKDFVLGYAHSETYETAEKRKSHWNMMWSYLKDNPNYCFSCPYILGLKLPGSAFDCKRCTVGHTKDDTVIGDDTERAGCYLNSPLPFPMDIFPPIYRTAIEEHARAFAVSEEIPACAVLSLAGACIGRSRGVMIKAGWVEHANLWIALVGDSGTGKSPAARSMHAHAFKLERQWYKEFKEATERFNAEVERRRSLPPKERKELPPPPKAPVWKQLIIDDATTEALTDALASNPKGILWYRDELAGLILDLDKYSNGKDGSSKSRLMSAYDSGPWKVNRVSKQNLIPNANLSIFGTIQPGALPEIFSNLDAATGFLPRFILVRTVQNSPPLWTDAVVSEASQKAIMGLIERLLGYHLGDEDEPEIIQVSDEARLSFQSWYNEQACEPWVNADANVYKAVLAKLRGQCLRFALILHCMHAIAENESELKPISVEIMGKAIQLANSLKEHQKSAWQFVVNAGQVKELTPIQKRVVGAILDLEGEIVKGMIPTARITDVLNHKLDKRYQISSKSVGKTLASLKLTVKHLPDKTARGVCVNEAEIGRFKDLTLETHVLNVPNVPNVSHEPNEKPKPHVQQMSRTSVQTSGNSPSGHLTGHYGHFTDVYKKSVNTDTVSLPDITDVSDVGFRDGNPGLVQCGCCRFFDGRWCIRREGSWNKARGQEAEVRHECAGFESKDQRAVNS